MKEASRGTEAESQAPVHDPKRRRREEEDGIAGSAVVKRPVAQ